MQPAAGRTQCPAARLLSALQPSSLSLISCVIKGMTTSPANLASVVFSQIPDPTSTHRARHQLRWRRRGGTSFNSVTAAGTPVVPDLPFSLAKLAEHGSGSYRNVSQLIRWSDTKTLHHSDQLIGEDSATISPCLCGSALWSHHTDRMFQF